MFEMGEKSQTLFIFMTKIIDYCTIIFSLEIVGLPPSPPMAPADIAVINGMPYSVQDPNQSKVHPLGVDVTKQRHKHRLNGIVIGAIVFSAVLGVLICCSIAWVLVFRHTKTDPQPAQNPRVLPSLARSSGDTLLLFHPVYSLN